MKDDAYTDKRNVNEAEKSSRDTADDRGQVIGADIDSNGDLNRRTYLKAGVAALAVGSSAIPSSVTAASERYGIQFDTVLNAVDDLGLDSTGSSAIDSTLAEALSQGNVLVEFPAGTYYFNDTITFGSPNNWGVRGLGDESSEVRFVTTPGEGRYLFTTRGGTGQLVENFTLDYSADDDGCTGMFLQGEDEVRIQDIEYAGFNPTRGNGAEINLAPEAISPDGTVIVDGLVRTGPTDIVSHGSKDGDANAACIWLGSDHEGTLIIRNTHIENTGTNGVYGSRVRGSVHFENCLFRNNNQTSIRIGGGEGKENTVKNCTFVIDTNNASSDNRGEYINPHAIVCETNRVSSGPISIENSDFMYKSGPDRGNLLFVDGNAGPLEITNSRFRSEVDHAQLLYGQGEPRWSDPAPDLSIDMHECQFSGSGSMKVTERPATIHSGCISSPSSGVTITDSVSQSQCTVPNTDAPAEIDSETTTSLPNEIQVIGTGTRTNFQFSAGGALQGTDDNRSWDVITDSSVDGWVTTDGNTKTFDFSGPLSSVEFVEGDADISINDQQVDPSTLSTDTQYPNTLQIPATGSSRNYRVTVSGDIVDHPVLGTPLSEYDVVSNGTIEGWTTDEMDAIQFSGSIESIEYLEGDGSMYLNGTEIDPETYDTSEDEHTTDDETDESTEQPALPKTIVIDGSKTEHATWYEFSVSGDLERSDELSSGSDATVLDGLTDTVSDGTARGYVSLGIDGYRFSGVITSISIRGNASVSIDDADS